MRSAAIFWLVAVAKVKPLGLLAHRPGALPSTQDRRLDGTIRHLHGGHVIRPHHVVRDALLLAFEPPRAVGRHGSVPLVVIDDILHVGLKIAGHGPRRAHQRDLGRLVARFDARHSVFGKYAPKIKPPYLY